MPRRTALSSALLAALLASAAGSAHAQSAVAGSEAPRLDRPAPQEPAAPPSAVQPREDPYARATDTFIRLNGKIDTVARDDFVLDYGRGAITVEMDDWDPAAETRGLHAGDHVTVWGIVDDDFFAGRTIEASGVYVRETQTYLPASAIDDEADRFADMPPADDPQKIAIRGAVTAVDERRFKVDTGERTVTVDVEDLANDPLDAAGYQRVRRGDVVSVIGTLDFDRRTLEADSVRTIRTPAERSRGDRSRPPRDAA